MKRLMLCTDLDRTLLPNGPYPESEQARQRFHKLAMHPGVCLVYVTGRHKMLVKDAILEFGIPVPDYVISDVGSRIYKVTGEQWQHVQAWDDKIGKDWHGITHQHLQSMCSGFTEMTLQEPDKQSRFKLSFYVPLDCQIKELVVRLQHTLGEHKINAEIVWSIDEENAVGLLDILPVSANKHHAIKFLMNECGYTLYETIFAGDSGNDVSVMLSDIRSVMVANAMPEVKQEVIERASLQGMTDTVYLARGGYLNMNGNYSAGILEGVAHYMPDMEAYYL